MEDCLIWTGANNGNGYGRKGTEYVHRLAYVEAYGPIPDGKEIHHLCFNRACYNAEHLVAVTHVENVRFSLKDVCKHGHVFDEENTYVGKDGKRRCRACGRNRVYAKRGIGSPQRGAYARH